MLEDKAKALKEKLKMDTELVPPKEVPTESKS